MIPDEINSVGVRIYEGTKPPEFYINGELWQLGENDMVSMYRTEEMTVAEGRKSGPVYMSMIGDRKDWAPSDSVALHKQFNKMAAAAQFGAAYGVGNFDEERQLSIELAGVQMRCDALERALAHVEAGGKVSIIHDEFTLHPRQSGRFVLFAYDDFNPMGGAQDCRGWFDTVEEAAAAGKQSGYTNIDVLDTDTGEWVL